MNRLSHLVGLIVFCFACFTSSLNAQTTVTVGTGTAFSETFPLNGYYNYSWSNSIYLSSQIGISGSLTSIAFYVENISTNIVMNNQKIYVRHTSATSYSSTTYQGTEGFTLIYDGAITLNGQGWKTINLTTPFNFNGSENLEFLFENRDGSYVTTFPYYRYTTTGTGVNRTRRDYQDATFPSSCYTCATVNAIPNMQFTITPCSFNSGIATASLASVVPGNTATVNLTNQTEGSAIQWQSSLDNLTFTNISGATSQTYTETVYATKYYRAMLVNGSCSKLSTTTTVTADLATMSTKTIGVGTTQSEKYPFNNYYDYSWSNMIYKASEINGSGKLSRISFDVATLPANYTAVNQTIYVRHTTQNTYTTNTYPTTAGFTKVYEGNIVYSATGWKEVVFDNQFYYNGTDNLEFLFENRDGSYTSSYPVFNSSIVAETRTRRDYKDVSFPDACNLCNRVTNLMNIQMKFFPCTSTPGTASATSTSLCSGTNTTLSVAGQTTGSTIQWQSSGNNTTFTNISGATSASYVTPNLTATTYYKAVVTSGICIATTNTLTVGVSSTTAGTISTSKTSICLSDSVNLSLSGQTAGATIQWFSSSDNSTFSPITGAISTTLITPSLTSTMYYYAAVTNGYCTVNTATTIISLIEVNAGTASATNTTVLIGGSSQISIVDQTAGATIQWKSSNDNVTFTDIAGATNTTYTANNLLETLYFKAVVTNSGCSATSNTVTITVDISSLTSSAIGTGTVGFDKYPFNGYYDYSWASMLYKASEINSTGKLARVSFYVDNAPVNETMNNQKIYVRHTNIREYSDAVYSTPEGYTLVYDGSITYNGSGWKEIVLQNQFEYNGVDDLEFLFENRDGSWTTTHPIFRGQSGMPDVRVKRDYSDATFPETCVNCNKFNNILNIQMKFMPCEIAGGTLTAQSTSVRPSENVQLTLSGQETTGTVQWQSSIDNISFVNIINQTGTTLAIPMTLSPLYIRTVTTLGCSEFSNVVTITPDNCFQSTIQAGTGILETYKFPFNVWYNYSWSNVLYTKEEVGPAGKIASISFNVTNTPVNYVTNNQKIYVRQTSARDYTDATYSGTIGFTQVFEGIITYNGQGWKEIVFTTPFDYDGTSNLEFLFENRDGSYGDSYPKFAYTDGQTTFRTKRDYDDNGFPTDCARTYANCGRSQNIPNIKFKFLAPVNVLGSIVSNSNDLCPGGTTTLSFISKISEYSIQWQISEDNITYTTIPGAISPNYTTKEIMSTTFFRAKVSEKDGCSILTNTIGIKTDNANCCKPITFYSGLVIKDELGIIVSNTTINKCLTTNKTFTIEGAGPYVTWGLEGPKGVLSCVDCATTTYSNPNGIEGHGTIYLRIYANAADQKERKNACGFLSFKVDEYQRFCDCNNIITITPEKKFYCPDDLIQFHVVNLNNVPITNFSFSWSPTAQMSCSDCFNPLVFPNASTIYNLTITTASGVVCPLLSRAIRINTTDCPDPALEIIGCSFSNYGAGVYVKPGTKMNVYCNVTNEVTVNDENTIEKGEFMNKGEISSTIDWINNGQNELYISPEGKTTLMGDYQKLRGTSSINFYDLILKGSSKKEMFIDEYVKNTLLLNDMELAARNNTCFLENTSVVSVTRNFGFISTDMPEGHFSRDMIASATAYIYPMGSTQGVFRYRPVEIGNVTASNEMAIHFENTQIPTSLDISNKAPNVLSMNDKYYYKISSSEVSPDISITMYYNQTEGSYQAISHWTNNTSGIPANWWVNTPGSNGSTVVSTNVNTLGLVSASTNGVQSMTSENFTLAEGGFILNTTDFVNTSTDPDAEPDPSDPGSGTGGTGTDPSPGTGTPPVITVTSTPLVPGGGTPTGGGLGDPTTTGETGYSPTPLAGIYTVDVDAGSCGVDGKIQFAITTLGEVDPTTVKFFPNTADLTQNYLLSTELYSIAPFGQFNLSATPESLTEICHNSLSVKMGNQVGNESYVLSLSSPLHIAEIINITSTTSLITPVSFSIDGTVVSLPSSIFPINLDYTGPSTSWATTGVHKYQLTVQYSGQNHIINGQFIIK